MGVCIPIIGVALGLFFLSNTPVHYDLEIHGMNDTYFVGDTYTFYYTLSGFGNTCGSWIAMYPNHDGDILHRGEVIDCTDKQNNPISYDSRKDSREFSLAVPQIEGRYNVTVRVESADQAVYEFTVISNPEDDKRRLGFTPAFEYHKVRIDGEQALQICSLLNVMCPQNPVFHAINRHDKNYTYFYYDLPNKDYLVVVDDGQICYTTDDVDFENTGIYEKCTVMENVESGAYELDEALCIGGRGYIKNDECERIGKYDIQTGIPIVESKVQCDLLDGTWYAEQDKCDSEYAPTEYRLQFGNSFLGYDIPQICTYDIMKHLAKYSNLLDKKFVGEYGIEDIGLPDGVTQEKFDECTDFIFKQRTELLENTDVKTTLEEVLESCANDSPKERMENILRYTNETHVFLNLECEWKKIGKYLGE